MKSKIVLLVSGLMIALCLTVSSCCKIKFFEEEKVWDTLPPETQEGAKTFGCYVNGELFVPRKGVPFQTPPLYATYTRRDQYLYISCKSVDHYINLFIKNPKENEYNALAVGYFAAGLENDCFGFGCSDCNSVFITRFDTIKRIVSGTFEFSGRCASISFDESGVQPTIKITGDSVVQITKGRFDIRYSHGD